MKIHATTCHVSLGCRPLCKSMVEETRHFPVTVTFSRLRLAVAIVPVALLIMSMVSTCKQPAHTDAERLVGECRIPRCFNHTSTAECADGTYSFLFPESNAGGDLSDAIAHGMKWFVAPVREMRDWKKTSDGSKWPAMAIKYNPDCVGNILCATTWYKHWVVRIVLVVSLSVCFVRMAGRLVAWMYRV